MIRKSLKGMAAAAFFTGIGSAVSAVGNRVAGKVGNGDGRFTVIWVTDTHIQTTIHRDHVIEANQWVIKNRDELNIGLFIHTGDVTHNGTVAHYELAKEAYADLYDSGIPVLMSIGNHDYDDELRTGEIRRADRWNEYFGLRNIDYRSWFGSAYETGKAENYYAKFSSGKKKVLIFILEFGPRAGVLDWVRSVCRTNPSHKVLIFTHSYMNEEGLSNGESTDSNLRVASPSLYDGTGDDVNDGGDMWEKAFKHCGNICSVHSGHTRPADLERLPEFSGFRETVKDVHDRDVFQEYHNFQWITYGMRPQYDTRGYMRIMRFDLEENRVDVETYSPVENRYREEEKHSFSFAQEGPVKQESL